MINDRKTDRVGDAIQQMQKLIERFVTHSLKGDLFTKALECMRTLRESCVKEDEAPSFNKFAERIKSLALKTATDSENFFKLMADAKLTLITKHESAISSVVE
jgi:ATP-dependent DNA helicase 2 subunit 2